MIRRRLFLIVSLGALVLTASSCAASSPGSESSGTHSADAVELLKPGHLTMCTNVPYAPFEYLDESGAVVGFDVAIAQEVAKDLGATFEVTQAPFEGIQSGQDLSVGNCDVALSGMTITEDRKQVMDFSAPYFEATQGLLVPSGSKVTGLESLAGKKVAVMIATTGEKYAKDKGLETIQFEDLGLQIEALKTGQVAAVINDYAALLPYTKSEKMKVAADFNTGEQYGIGIKKGNAGLLAAVNRTLERIESDGTYTAIYTKFIGAPPTGS